jgi:hypothetical protein
MGHLYYGTHSDKNVAMEIADTLCRRAKKGVCWTPASRVNSCSFDPATSLWTCLAKAHNHEGSCKSKEIHWNLGKPGDGEGPVIPVITWNPKNKIMTDDRNEESETENYTDAMPEDY